MVRVVFGLCLKDGDRVWNAALFVDDKGDDIGWSRKTHLRGHDRSSSRTLY